MMDAISVYNDVKDNVNTEENGDFSYSLFNRNSRRAELRMIDWLTGDVEGLKPPEPYLTQKNKDWISFLIVKKNISIINGFSETRPADYYAYENQYLITGDTACEKEDDDTEPTDQEDISHSSNKAIELLDGAQFNGRCDTYIESLKPSVSKPISKMVGKKFEYAPKDLPAATLEYIRYPKFAEIKTKMDVVYNQEVPDPITTQNYEWDEFARELLVWFITDTFSIHNREQALKQSNMQTKKTERG